MKRFLYVFLACLFLFLNLFPFNFIFANEINITGTPIPVQGDITDDQLTDIIVSGITADLVSQGYQIDLSAADGDWDNFKNAILDIIFDGASDGTGFIGEIYNSALYHNLIGDDLTIWYPDTSDDTILPGLSKRSIYRNLSDGLVNNILDHRSDGGSTPTPNPNPDYTNLCTMIGSYNIGNVNNYKSLVDYPIFCANGISDSYRVYVDSPCTFYSSTASLGTYNSNNQYNLFAIDFLSIYYNSSTGIITYSNTGGEHFIYNNNRKNSIKRIYFNENSQAWFNNYNVPTNQTYEFESYKSDVNVFINYVFQQFRNVNVYVDNDLWVYADNNSLPTIIINPGYVLQGTDLPMNYNFPDPPYFDYQRMIDIIKHALLQYGVIQWEDIADVFVDVNGQTAVAILEIHRNDYDVLYDEQYPGIALPNRFNTHLLDTSHQYLSPVVQTVEETTSILPGDIKGALAIGMMLTIFACLIHRLLE